MAYKKHEQAIIPGSLNLLAPGDKSSEGDCLQLTNWRVDQAGQLTQRWGWTALNALQLSAYTLNRVAQVDSFIYFAGNGLLYMFGVLDPGGADGNIDAGYSLEPVSIVSLQGKAWVMNDGAQRRANSTHAQNWTPETPGVPTLAKEVVAGSTLAAGDWEYYITFETVEGYDGNPAAVQIIAGVALGEAVTITRPARVELMSAHDNYLFPPRAADPAITGWNVFRTGPGLGAIYRVNENVIPYATNSYIDAGAVTAIGTNAAQSNEDLQDRNITLETDHDAAPAAIGAIAGGNGGIIAFRTLAMPNRLFYTRANEPWYFPAANYIDVGAVNDTIMAVSQKPNQLVIYKQKSIWRHIGDLGSGRLEKMSDDLGCIGINAIARSSSGDYIVGKEGVYRWNGESGKKVSTKLDPLFKDEDVTIAFGITYEKANGNLSNCALGIRNGRLYFSYPTAAGAYPSDSGRTAVMDIESGRWVDWESAWNDYFDQGQNGNLITAGDQVLGTMEIGYSDDTAGGPLTAYDCIYHSRYEDQGAPDKEKTYADLVIEHNTRGQPMTISVWTNNGIAAGNEFLLGSITSTARNKTIFRVIDGSGNPVRAYNLAVRIEGSTNIAQTTPIIIYAIFLHSYLEATQARTFDTDEMSLGSALVKEIRGIAIDAQVYGVSSLDIWTDYPGNEMVKRFAFLGGGVKGVNPTIGRTRVQIPVDQYTFGRLLRVTMQSAESKFQIYGMWVFVRTIGVFIEGYETLGGGIWYSDHQDFGTSDVKLARELELDIDTGGAVTYTLYSDLPGNNLANRATGTVNTVPTAARRRIVRVPVTCEGRQFALHLASAGYEIILYGARLEVKPYGVYVEAYEAAAGLRWDSDLRDLGIQDVKDFAEIQFDIDTDGSITYTVLTDLPLQTMASRATAAFDTTATTTGRRMVNIPLSNVQGHLLQVLLGGTSAFRLYGIRVRVRPYFYYVEASAAAAGAIYDSTELSWGTASPKEFDSLVVEYEGGPLTATFYTDLPGDAMASRVTYTVPAASGRRTATIPLNQVKGRLARFTLAGSAAYKLYAGFVRLRPVAVYLNANNAESYRTRDMDFGSEAVKMFGEFEIDFEINGTATLNVYADQPSGIPALAASFTLTGAGARKTQKCRPGALVKGRLIRLAVGVNTAAITIHALRVYVKAMGQRGPTEWTWAQVPMPSTPDTYTEVNLPVKATPDQWEWVDLPIKKTPSEFEWVEFPVKKTPSEFEWVEVPVEQ